MVSYVLSIVTDWRFEDQKYTEVSGTHLIESVTYWSVIYFSESGGVVEAKLSRIYAVL